MIKFVAEEVSDCAGREACHELEVRREISYRRGFVQGAASAIRAIKAGKNYDQLEDWMLDLHLKWRPRARLGKTELPNELV